MSVARAVPRVSIALPVYNGARYLAETLRSLAAQTFADFELIICDNASTDATRDIAQAFAARDARVRYTRNATNIGLGRNFRRGLELATGRYFKWAMCDDLLGPEFLARCVEVLDRDPSVVLAYPRTKLIDEAGTVISDYEDGLHLPYTLPAERFAALYRRLGLCNAQLGVLRTAVLRRIAPYGTYIASDVCLLAELTLYGTFWEVPAFLYFRRFHEAASSRKTFAELQAYYDPNRPPGAFMRTWRHMWEHVGAVKRAPLTFSDKARLSGLLMWMTVARSPALVRELAAAGRELLRGQVGAVGASLR
jgi:glycosyltransferase involved in cell wall biosynthesis